MENLIADFVQFSSAKAKTFLNVWLFFWLYISGINKAFIRKFQRTFFFKVLSVSNFLIIKEENYSSLQDNILAHGKTNFYSFLYFKWCSLWSKSPVKIKRTDFFAINNDMQKLSFWKLFTERGVPGKKVIDFDCTSSLFPLFPNAFGNLPIYVHVHFKNNNLKFRFPNPLNYGVVYRWSLFFLTK